MDPTLIAQVLEIIIASEFVCLAGYRITGKFPSRENRSLKNKNKMKMKKLKFKEAFAGKFDDENTLKNHKSFFYSLSSSSTLTGNQLSQEARSISSFALSSQPSVYSVSLRGSKRENRADRDRGNPERIDNELRLLANPGTIPRVVPRYSLQITTSIIFINVCDIGGLSNYAPSLGGIATMLLGEVHYYMRS